MLRVLTTLVAVFVLSACAPRSSRTHFDRWAEETEKRHAQEAQAKAQEAASSPLASKTAEPAQAAAPTPPIPSASPKRESPPVAKSPSSRTSTRARVVKPSDTKKTEEDDAIY
jgi:hypothetical protein